MGRGVWRIIGHGVVKSHFHISVQSLSVVSDSLWVIKNPLANAGDALEIWVQSLGWEDPWSREWQPTPVFMLGKSHRQRSLVGYSPWGGKRVWQNWGTEHTNIHTHTHTHKYIYGSDLGHLSFKCWWNFLFERSKDYRSGSCSVMSYSLRPHGIYIQSMEFSSQNTGVGSLRLLQGIFPTQGCNPGLPHRRQFLYQLSHKGMQRILEWVAYHSFSGSSHPRNWTRVSCIAGGFFTNWVIREIPQGLLDEPILLPGEESGWKYRIMEYRCDGYCITKSTKFFGNHTQLVTEKFSRNIMFSDLELYSWSWDIH